MRFDPNGQIVKERMTRMAVERKRGVEEPTATPAGQLAVEVDVGVLVNTVGQDGGKYLGTFKGFSFVGTDIILSG